MVAILLICLSFQFACTRGTESTEAARETGPRLTNAELKNQVETKLNSDTQLRGLDISIDADADRNRVTLSGTVHTDAQRMRAAELARMGHPGVTVENKLEVKPREYSRSEYTDEMAREEVERARTRKETIGNTTDDAWIHAKIVGQLIGDWDTPARKINVDVNNNIVTLRGTVDTPQAKTEAERIAKQSVGVKSVRNQLKVAKTE
jgi:osmotically-inducible protein OsmY